jgi:hypothetical protein
MGLCGVDGGVEGGIELGGINFLSVCCAFSCCCARYPERARRARKLSHNLRRISHSVTSALPAQFNLELHHDRLPLAV